VRLCFFENVKKERVIEFSFSVQSLMNRLVFRCLCFVGGLGEPTSGGFWFSLGTYIFSLDTNARAFPMYDVPPALCKFAAIKNVKDATRSCPGSPPVYCVSGEKSY
jgi:hypothetical protein